MRFLDFSKKPVIGERVFLHKKSGQGLKIYDLNSGETVVKLPTEWTKHEKVFKYLKLFGVIEVTDEEKNQ